jgi:hypothetical protein
MLHILSVCFVAFGIQHVNRMRHNMLSSVAGFAPHNFSKSHKRHYFKKEKNIGHKLCVLVFFSNFCRSTFLILRRIRRDIIVNVHWVGMQSVRCYCRFLMELEFSRQIFQNIWISDFMKIRPLGAELFHADRQT